MTAAALFFPSELQQWRLPVVAFSLVSILVLLLSWSWTRRRRSRSALNLPPGPQALPIVGNLLQIGALPHRSLRALARQHGPVMLLRLGSVPTVVVSSPEAARAVMKTHDARCCGRPAMSGPRRLTYGYKDVAFAPYGDHVRAMRRLFVLELLSMRRVQAAWDARVAQARRLVANLTRCAGAGAGPSWRPVALDEHIFGAVDGIVGTVVFGEIYGTERFSSRFLSIVNDAMDMLGSFSAEDFFPGAAGRLVDRLTGLAARRDRVFERLDAFFEEVIDGHLNTAQSEGNPRSDLLQALIGLFKDKNDASTVLFTRDHIKAMLFHSKMKKAECESLEC